MKTLIAASDLFTEMPMRRKMAGKHSKSFNSVQPPVRVPSYVVWDQTTVEPVASVDPKREIAACASCHGPGGYLIGAPALINQNALYLEQQLTAFAQGTRTNDTNMPMRTIAGLLTPAEMKSLAFAYSKGLEGSRRKHRNAAAGPKEQLALPLAPPLEDWTVTAFAESQQ